MSIWPMRRAHFFLQISKFFPILLHSVLINMAEDQPTTPTSSRLDSNRDDHPVFGKLMEELPKFRLPTFLQVLNRTRFLKSQMVNRQAPLRPIYQLVASELEAIWKSAFVVPIISTNALITKLQTEVEKKIKQIRTNLTFYTRPEKLSTELATLKKVYNISKCKCFVNTSHRQDIIKSSCKCPHPILNLECYGDQMHGFAEFIIFEEQKVFFEQKMAEMESISTNPTPPPTPTEDAGYFREYPEVKRARAGSYGNVESPDVEMGEPSNNVDWDPVLEAFAAAGVHPGPAYKILSLIIIVLKLSPDLLSSESTWRRRFHQLYGKNG